MGKKRKYPSNYFGVKLSHPLNLSDEYVLERKFTFLNWQHSNGKITHVGVVSFYQRGKMFYKVVYLSKKKTVYKGYYNTYKLTDGSIFGSDYTSLLANVKLLLDTLVTIDDFLKMFDFKKENLGA